MMSYESSVRPIRWHVYLWTGFITVSTYNGAVRVFADLAANMSVCVCAWICLCWRWNGWYVWFEFCGLPVSRFTIFCSIFMPFYLIKLLNVYGAYIFMSAVCSVYFIIREIFDTVSLGVCCVLVCVSAQTSSKPAQASNRFGGERCCDNNETPLRWLSHTWDLSMVDSTDECVLLIDLSHDEWLLDANFPFQHLLAANYSLRCFALSKLKGPFDFTNL